MRRWIPVLAVLILAIAAASRMLDDEEGGPAPDGAEPRLESQAGEPRAPAVTAEGNRPAASRAAVAAVQHDESPPEPGIPSQVRVITATSYAHDAERVPGLAFELLLSPGQTERGQTELGDDLEPWGVGLVTFGASQVVVVASQAEVVARGRTGVDGETLVELGPTSGGADPPPLFGRLVEPGFQQRLGIPRALENEGGCQVVRLIARPGSTARGRVVDGAGAPVDAKVELRAWAESRGVRSLDHRGSARNTGAGTFELDLSEDELSRGTSFVLHAQAAGIGTGAREIELSLDDPPQDLELVVSGEGALRGRVSDAGAAPAPGLSLLVLLAELDEPSESFVLPEPAASLHLARGGGRIWGTPITDADGRFEVRGLRAAPYVVRAQVGDSSDGYPYLLTPVPVPADGKELSLSLSRPHLAVRLLDEHGNPHAGALPVAAWDSYQASAAPHAWPTRPYLSVHPASDSQADGLAVASDFPPQGRVVSACEVVFEIEDPGPFLVGALGGGYDGTLQRVEVAPSAGRVEVELRAAATIGLGAVDVRVWYDGRELEGTSLQEPEFDVYLEQIGTAAVLVSRESYGPPSPFRLEAPPGRYRLVAEGKPFIEDQHGTLLTPRLLGRVEREFVLVAGETTEIDLELAVGAKIELTLEGTPTRADAAACHEEHGEWGEEWVEHCIRRARLELRAPGRRPLAVECTEQWSGTSAAGTHLTDLFELGTTAETQMLPAGRYELVARQPGGRMARAPVELVAGRTTPVALRFE